MQGLNNTTKPGLHGGKVSSIEMKLNITEQLNGIVYTCQATNEALQRSVHDAITLQVLCKYQKRIMYNFAIIYFVFIYLFYLFGKEGSIPLKMNRP